MCHFAPTRWQLFARWKFWRYSLGSYFPNLLYAWFGCPFCYYWVHHRIKQVINKRVLPEWIPILSLRLSLGLWGIRKLLTSDNNRKERVQISAAWIGFSTGSPDTTMYASPIVSTLYTSYSWIARSKIVYNSFRKFTTSKGSDSLQSLVKPTMSEK